MNIKKKTPAPCTMWTFIDSSRAMIQGLFNYPTRFIGSSPREYNRNGINENVIQFKIKDCWNINSRSL